MPHNQLRLSIARTEPYAGGESFGDTGPYERLQGKVAFAIDPNEEGLPYICDLDLAPRNAAGFIEFQADVDILKPLDMGRSNRRLMFEFSNRGNRAVVSKFNDSNGIQPGNGFLMRQGYTVAWCGWQGDLISGGNNLVAYLPPALENGQPVRGRVRQELISDTPGVLSMPVSGGANIDCYPVLDRATTTLTAREREGDPRAPVADDQWELARAEVKGGQVTLTPSPTDLYIKGGFTTAWIYELIYDTEGSRVMDLGFLGLRDFISFTRHEAADTGGEANPLAGAIDHAYAYGASLSGRVVREWVYEGWNADASGRKVFDGMQPHTGSGRLFMNQRFAQVGRYARQHEDHSWATERYPFTFLPIPDPFTGKVEGLLKRPATDPLMVHTHTSGDYWHRHCSLNHTDCRDGSDVEIPETVRMYALTSTPHADRSPGPDWLGQAAPNGIGPGPVLRANLTLLDRWVTEGVAPPPSRLPRRADGTLTAPEAVLARFPKVPGLRLPDGPSRMAYYDYGPDFDQGYITVFPPEAIAGQEYPVQVPQIDADGNEVPGLRSPDIEAPLGTYTGWAVRKAGFAEGDLVGNSGSFVPFARTQAERQASGDPRPSIAERYPTHDAYVTAVATAVQGLVNDGLLLTEDAGRYLEAARRKNPLDPSVPLGPLLA